MVQAIAAAVTLAMLRSLDPTNATVHHEIAGAITDAANRDPIYESEDGAARAATVLVSLAWHESRFRPSAVGDGGASLGLFQIQPATWKLDANTLLSPRSSAPVALALIKRSFRECKARPWLEWLSWYAASSSCGKGVPAGVVRQSAERMHLADKLFRTYFPEMISSLTEKKST